MNDAITTFDGLKEFDTVELGGYDWILWTTAKQRSLNPTGARQLAGCRIYEDEGKDGVATTYSVAFEHPVLRDLRATRREFANLTEAVAWAVSFQWETRRVGSLTWVESPGNDQRWYAEIGASEAMIFQSSYDGTFTVTRDLMLGRQLVKFQITDLAYGKDESKTITSFEHASAIALTMTDFVMELMRNVEKKP